MSWVHGFASEILTHRFFRNWLILLLFKLFLKLSTPSTGKKRELLSREKGQHLQGSISSFNCHCGLPMSWAGGGDIWVVRGKWRTARIILDNKLNNESKNILDQHQKKFCSDNVIGKLRFILNEKYAQTWITTFEKPFLKS